MNQYDWATCPTAVETQVNTFCAHLQALLETNLSGIYLHYGESHREQYRQALINGEWMRWNGQEPVP